MKQFLRTNINCFIFSNLLRFQFFSLQRTNNMGMNICLSQIFYIMKFIVLWSNILISYCLYFLLSSFHIALRNLLLQKHSVSAMSSSFSLWITPFLPNYEWSLTNTVCKTLQTPWKYNRRGWLCRSGIGKPSKRCCHKSGKAHRKATAVNIGSLCRLLTDDKFQCLTESLWAVLGGS